MPLEHYAGPPNHQPREELKHGARAFTLPVVVCCALLAAAGVRAEQPSIESLAQAAYIILPHHYLGVYAPREGLWSFNLDTGEYLRISPFYDQSSTEGQTTSDAYLAAREDALVWQGWPGWLEFELPTARLLRRYYPLHTPDLYGWMLQGPAVPASVGASLGLAGGIYGSPLCVNDFLYLGFGNFRLCEPYQYPGAPVATTVGSGVILLQRPFDADEAGLTFAADLRSSPSEDFTSSCGVLTFDPLHLGFWCGGGQRVSFFPVQNGQIGPASTVIDPIPPLYGTEAWDIFMQFAYHPGKDLLLANVTPRGTPGYRPRFVALDRDLRVVKTYAAQDPPYPDPVQPIPTSIGALPGTLPAEYVQTVPIVAHTSGVNGTFWTSELWLYNPSSQPITARVRRVAAPGSAEKTIELPGHGSLGIADALAWAGGGPAGDGVTHDAFVVTSPYRWGEQLAVASRSSTPSSDPAERAAGGTLGHAVPAVPGRMGYTNHLPDQDPGHIGISGSTGSEPAQVVLDLRNPGQYRHNLGVVNDSDQPITVTLRWGFSWFHFDEMVDGSLENFSVPPHRAQITNIEQLFPAAIRLSWPPKISISATQPAIIWMSMVDNITGDGTFVPFTNLNLQGDTDKRAAIPAVAHLPGENGTFWKTDLYGPFWDQLSNFEEHYDDQPMAWFHPAWPATNCGGAVAAGGELSTHLDGTVGMPLADWIAFRTIPGYPPPDPERAQWSWRTVYPDVIHLFPECAADNGVRGALEVRTGSWMTAYARNYTTRADGGTFGDMLPLYPWDGWPVQHFAGIDVSARYRINLGLYNGNKDHAITQRLSLYASNGTLVAQREATLGPWENLQDRLERLLGLEVGSLAEGVYGLTVVPLDDLANNVEGRSWAYVSLVDNVTGDPTHLW